MSEPTRTCSTCGAALAARGAAESCPSCLLRLGLAEALLASDEGQSSEETFAADAAVPGEFSPEFAAEYELLSLLDRGGMGVVYRARQRKLDRPVALKMLLPELLADESAVRQFYEEARAVAALRHPGIVAIYQVGEERGRHYFSMEFVEGRNLAQVAAHRPMAPERAAKIVQAVAEAIHFAHSRGVLHCDLKPQNILIDAHEHPRVTDFGLARFMGRGAIDDWTAARGSPAYVSPEQAAGQSALIGPPSDIYSLGAVLYELLTGRPPFLAPTATELLWSIERSAITRPRTLQPSVPVRLEDICLRCLARAPYQRYASAEELAEALRLWLDGRTTASARAKWIGAAAALVIVAMIGSGIFLWQRENSSSIETPASPGVNSASAVPEARAPVRVVAPLPMAFTTLAGRPGPRAFVDGPRRDARFTGPHGVAVDVAGNVYVTENSNHAVRKITLDGADVAQDGMVSTLAGKASERGFADGARGAARFNVAVGIEADRDGNLFVADHDNHVIRKVTPEGVVSTFAGLARVAGSADGKAGAARFNIPTSVAVDAAGNVYVAERGNHTIRKITAAGEVSTLAGLAGTLGSADGTGVAARFNEPQCVAVDRLGNVYVADCLNSTIRKITPDGDVSTLAGSAGSVGSADGAGADARFNQPMGVAVDPTGNVYVADTLNATIRKISTAGTVSTIGGQAGLGGNRDGVGGAARFLRPRRIAIDLTGNLYIADMGNQSIRRGAIDGSLASLIEAAGGERARAVAKAQVLGLQRLRETHAEFLTSRRGIGGQLSALERIGRNLLVESGPRRAELAQDFTRGFDVALTFAAQITGANPADGVDDSIPIIAALRELKELGAQPGAVGRPAAPSTPRMAPASVTKDRAGSRAGAGDEAGSARALANTLAEELRRLREAHAVFFPSHERFRAQYLALESSVAQCLADGASIQPAAARDCFAAFERVQAFAGQLSRRQPTDPDRKTAAELFDGLSPIKETLQRFVDAAQSEERARRK